MTTAALSRTTESAALKPTLDSAIARRLDAVSSGRWLALTVPAPPVEPHAMLDAAEAIGLNVQDHGVLWRPPEGASFAAVGAAVSLDLRGDDRFGELRLRAAEAFSRLDTDALDGAEATAPRAFGGFAFDVGAADAAPWHDFGDGCFTLPRWLYRRRDQGADLTLTVGADELAATPSSQWAERMTLLLRQLAATAERDPGFFGARPMELSRLEVPRLLEDSEADAAWVRLVEDIRGAIHSGDVEKIVAARRFTVELGASRPVARVLERLEQRRRATAFAFSRPGATFLGLTPERLITKKGMRFVTEALAGSIESGAEHAAELLDSGKDRLEQQLVVDAILRRLEPLAERLEAADRPSVRELPEVLHLQTPIRGDLNAPRHVLELAELLHPTPAVGGVPTPSALRWIRERENDARGWYASPVGWFDAAGDGEFFVALRSCLLLPGRAELYAGAGIVADSDPGLELDEVRLKLRTLLHALAA
ncbi:MAG: isochorismate synthase [Acidobacteriota bacterium]